MKLVNMLDGNGNIISKIKLEALAADPAVGSYVNGLSGAMYFNSISGTPRFHNGTEWVPVVKIAGTTGQTIVTYTGNPTSAIISLDPAIVGNFLPLSGGIMTGILYNTSGISATSISATTVSAGTISATNIYGNLVTVAPKATSAATADSLKNSQNFSLAGLDVSAAPISFNGSGPVVLSANLLNTGVSAGSYGTNVMIPNFIVDAKGRITSATQQALSISGANGGTVTSITVSSNILNVTNPTVTVSGTIGVNLPTTGTAGTYDKVVTDTYGRVTSGRLMTSADIPSLAGAYVPLSGGTMTGGLRTPSLTASSGGLLISQDGQGVTFFGGGSIYKPIGDGLRIKRHSGDIDPKVESYGSSATAWTIWHAGNLTGTQTNHNHYSQFSGVSGINYNSSNGQIGLASATTPQAGATKVTYDQYGRITSSGYITSSDIPDISNLYIAKSLQGSLGGVAIYDGNGKVYTSALPDVIVGQLHYGGVWNAATNTPTLQTASQVSGTYYIVQTSGNSIPAGDLSTQTQALVSAISGTTGIWNVGDWVVSNGTTWDKVDNTDSISTWNGRAGSVIPSAGDYNSTQITSSPVGQITGTTVSANMSSISTLINTVSANYMPKSGGTFTGGVTGTTIRATTSISAVSISAVNLYETGFAGNKVLISNVDKSIGESTITTTELGYLSGTSANIQEQLNGKMGGLFVMGDDYAVPVYSSATQSFYNSSSYVVGATKEKFVITDKTQAVTDDYHSPGIGVQIGMQPGTSGTNSTGFFFTMDTSGSTKLYNGKWYGSAWNNYWNITSAGVMQLPQMGGTSGIVAVTSAGNFVKYSLTSEDMPNMSNIYMPISGGDFSGKITAPSAWINNLSASGSIVMTDGYHSDTMIGYETTGFPFYIRVNGIDSILIDNFGDVTFNKNVQFQSGQTMSVYSSAEFNAPTTINSTLKVTGNIDASSSTISAFNIIGSGTSTFYGVSATSITTPTLNVTNIYGTNISATRFYEGGQLLSSRYLPLSGGNMTGNISFAYNNVSGDNLGIYGSTGSGNDGWRIIGQTAGSDQGALEIATMDNGNEPIYVRQYTNNSYATSAISRTLTLLDGSGNTTLPGALTIGNITTTAAYSGYAKFDVNGRIYKDTTVSDHKYWTSAVTITAGTYNISATHNLNVSDIYLPYVEIVDVTSNSVVLCDVNYSLCTANVAVIPISNAVAFNARIYISI